MLSSRDTAITSQSRPSRVDDSSHVATIASEAHHGVVINRAIRAASSYTPHAMITLLIMVKTTLHPFLDDTSAFTIPLCSRSITPLVSGYTSSRTIVSIQLEHNQMWFDQQGAFMKKMGICVTQMHLEGEGVLAAGVLPASLQSLTFHWSSQFNHPLEAGVLPASLQSLAFGACFNQPLPVGILPASLHSLDFGVFFDQPFAAGVLPASLHSLTFDSHFNQPFAAGVLPASLQSLSFAIHFNQPLTVGVLPASLHSLSLGHYFNQPLAAGGLPASLHSLTFDYSSRFNQPLTAGVLPASLHSLTFGDGSRFNQPLAAGVLPASLHSLTLGFYFNQPFAFGVFPSSLQRWHLLNDGYGHALTNQILPPHLHHMARG